MTEEIDDFPPEEEEREREERNRPSWLDNNPFGVGRRNNNMRSTVLDSFGLEVEVEKIPPRNLTRELRNYSWQEEHDASVETPAFFPQRERNQEQQLVYLSEQLEDTQSGVIGTEYVSGIMDINNQEHINSIYKLFEFICSSGEPEEGNRAGIHIHVSMPYNKNILSSSVRLFGFIEELTYYWGGMGYKFRGLENDFTYCRSLFNPAICYGDPPFYSYDFANLLDGSNKSVEHFFDAYGGINPSNPPGKYNPMRYGWITWYNLITKGTLELRVFNKTLNPNYVISSVKFFRALCESILLDKVPAELPINPVYSGSNKSQLFDVLYSLQNFVNVDPKTFKTIATIIDRTPEIKAEKKLVYTHLNRDRYTPQFKYYKKNCVKSNEVKTPNFVDIHTITGR